MSVGLSGMDDFLEELRGYEKAAGNVSEILMAGAEQLAEDIRKLPSPRRPGGGYTHMLDSVSAAKKDDSTAVVGWGKHYGMFLEHGTRKMRARPHMAPTWNNNKSRYYDLMAQKLHERR